MKSRSIHLFIGVRGYLYLSLTWFIVVVLLLSLCCYRTIVGIQEVIYVPWFYPNNKLNEGWASPPANSLL